MNKMNIIFNKTSINIKGKCMHCGKIIDDRKPVYIFENDRQYCTYCYLVATSYKSCNSQKDENSYIPAYVYDKEKGKGYLIASKEGMGYITDFIAEIEYRSDEFIINSFISSRSLRSFYLKTDDNSNLLFEKNDTYMIARFPSNTNVKIDDYLAGKYYSSYISISNDFLNYTEKNKKGLIKYLITDNYNIMGIIAFSNQSAMSDFKYQKCALFSRELNIISFGEEIPEKKSTAVKCDTGKIHTPENDETKALQEYSDCCSQTFTASEPENDIPDQIMRFRNTLSRRIYEVIRDIDFSEMFCFFKNRIKGQDKELKVALHMVIRYLWFASGEMEGSAPNWILTAPSGCGKTEFFRTVRDYFKIKEIPVPVIQIDLSRITEEGFKGDDPSSIMKNILNENSESEGIAICFLDEADKKCVPAYSSKGEDVNKAVQSNLLTIIEGIETTVELDKKGTKTIDTNLTMFVLMGAFQEIRNKKKARRSPKKCVGFETVSAEQKTNEAEAAFLDDVSIDEMIEYGMIEELAGRMMCAVNFKPISEKEMKEILVCKADEISKEFKNKIKLTEKAVDEFLKISYGPLGMRAAMNKIKELTERCIADVFFDNCYDPENDVVTIDGLDNAFISHTSSKTLKKKKLISFL